MNYIAVYISLTLRPSYSLYPCIDSNGGFCQITEKVTVWMSNYILSILVNIITGPCPNIIHTRVPVMLLADKQTNKNENITSAVIYPTVIKDYVT